MPPRTSGNTDRDWAQKFLFAINAVATDEVPPGFMTVAQWADIWGKGRSHANRLLNKAIKKGLAERKRFRIQKANRVYPVVHFRQLSRPTNPHPLGKR